MLNAVDISSSFSQSSLQLLADALLLAAKQKSSLAQPSHLIQILNSKSALKPILTKLGRTELVSSRKPGMKNPPFPVWLNFLPTLKNYLPIFC